MKKRLICSSLGIVDFIEAEEFIVPSRPSRLILKEKEELFFKNNLFLIRYYRN